MAHAHGTHGTPRTHAAAAGGSASCSGLTCAFLGVEVVAGVLTGQPRPAGRRRPHAHGRGRARAGARRHEVRRAPPSPRRTYGYHRVEILAALDQRRLVLAVVAGYILVEAWERFRDPAARSPTVPVLAVATVGLVVNLVERLRSCTPARAASLNVRGAYNEVLADALSSVGVILGAAVMQLHRLALGGPAGRGRDRALRPAAHAGAAAGGLHVLLEGTPREVDIAALRAAMEAVPGREEACTTSTCGRSPRASTPSPRTPSCRRAPPTARCWARCASAVTHGLPHQPRHGPARRALLRRARARLTSARESEPELSSARTAPGRGVGRQHATQPRRGPSSRRPGSLSPPSPPRRPPNGSSSKTSPISSSIFSGSSPRLHALERLLHAAEPTGMPVAENSLRMRRAPCLGSFSSIESMLARERLHRAARAAPRRCRGRAAPRASAPPCGPSRSRRPRRAATRSALPQRGQAGVFSVFTARERKLNTRWQCRQ